MANHSFAPLEAALISLKTRKVCSCCTAEFEQVPDRARWFDDNEPDPEYSLTGWYWECSCKTTLFVPVGWRR